jgi:tetratricopeptide (TPR) repeat protein
MDLQPVSYRNQQMYALALYYARRYDQAESQLKRLIELNPNHSFIHGRLIMVLEQQGKEQEAYKYMVEMLILQKTNTEKIERYRTAYRAAGWRGVVIERIKINEADGQHSYFQLACLYAKIGDKEKAFDYLEKAFEERSFQIPMLQVEPQLDPLRDDPRYQSLLARIEQR